MDKALTGSSVFDSLLEGGYEKDIITTLYGPAGSGKTCLCILASLECIKSGKKVIYIDTEGGFSVERLMQLAPDYKKFLDNMVFFKPVSFEEQQNGFDKLRKLVNDKIGLVVVDTISMLYRLEMGVSKDIYEVNKALGLQISYLSEMARKKNIPILVANQVYADFANKDSVNIVGGDLLKYGSKCMIELKATPDDYKKAIVRKHRSIEANKYRLYKIVQEGIAPVDTRKKIALPFSVWGIFFVS